MVRAFVEQPVEIDAHIGAVEVADADVDDAGGERRWVVARGRDAGGEGAERRAAQGDRAHASQFPPSTPKVWPTT